MIDWRDVFKRYADIVGEYEGLTFLTERDWPSEE